MRRIVWLVVVLGCGLLGGGCASHHGGGAAPVTLAGVAYFSMGWQVRVGELPPGMSAHALQQRLQARLDAANAVLSTYQPDTELMRFNQAPVGQWVRVSPLLRHALERALWVSAVTQGRYDVTVAPLVNLWGFGPEPRLERVPSAAEIEAVRARVGWRHLELDAARSSLRRMALVSMDLSSVGEGVAVDDLAATLEALGVRDYLVAVAGTLRSRGLHPDGKPWRLAIERPDGSGLPEQVLVFPAGAISTSGSYRNYFERDGVRYSHTMDPLSGRPVTHRGVSVTVVLPEGEGDSTLADAWATALNVLGPDAGLALATRHGLAVYYIERAGDGFRVRHSPAFTAYLPR